MKTFEIKNADCREVMRGLPENSIDSIVTDPPYGLEFMGKGWDRGVPGIEFWTEALRPPRRFRLKLPKAPKIAPSLTYSGRVRK